MKGIIKSCLVAPAETAAETFRDCGAHAAVRRVETHPKTQENTPLENILTDSCTKKRTEFESVLSAFMRTHTHAHICKLNNKNDQAQ